jgi:hypothetical protein
MRQDNSSIWGPQTLSWLFYGLAAIVAVAALLLGLTVGGASAAVPAAAIGFQSPALRPMWDVLVAGLQSLGWVVFAAGLILAALLLCGGVVLGRTVALARRVSRLEGELAVLQQGTAAPRQPGSSTARKSEVHTVV